jgi:hypothetical protein
MFYLVSLFSTQSTASLSSEDVAIALRSLYVMNSVPNSLHITKADSQTLSVFAGEDSKGRKLLVVKFLDNNSVVVTYERGTDKQLAMGDDDARKLNVYMSAMQPLVKYWQSTGITLRLSWEKNGNSEVFGFRWPLQVGPGHAWVTVDKNFKVKDVLFGR